MLSYQNENVLSTDREYVMQLLETSSVHWNEIIVVTWDDQEGRILKTLISTIPCQKLHQHMVFRKNKF